MGEKGEEVGPHLCVISGHGEVLGGGGSTEQCGRPRWLLGTAALRREGAVMDGLKSFTGMRGFHSRGQLGAWMAGVGSSTVRPASGGAMEVRRWFTSDFGEREIERAHVWAWELLCCEVELMVWLIGVRERWMGVLHGERGAAGNGGAAVFCARNPGLQPFL